MIIFGIDFSCKKCKKLLRGIKRLFPLQGCLTNMTRIMDRIQAEA